MHEGHELEIPAHLIGYRRDPKWRDMSDYLVHFTKTAESLSSILAQGQIRASGPFGWAKNAEPVRESQTSACFSEIPLDMLTRLMKRHGQFGIGFDRRFVQGAGGARVWYVDYGSPLSQSLFAKVGSVMRAQAWEDQIWAITPFIDNVIPGRYEFEWEREWRVVGGLTFTHSDVAFVLNPSGSKIELAQAVAIDAPIINIDGSGHGAWNTVPQALGSHLDQLTAEFLAEFDDPIHHLPWEEGDFVWLVDRFDTEDALDCKFESLEPGLREKLIEHLDGISTIWIRPNDLRPDE